MTTQCAELDQHGGLVATCRAEGDLASLDPAAALCLYRIGQEALRNVVVHARASRVDVELHRRGDSAGITITDDGRGFELASVQTVGRGLGLVSMSDRVRLAGGAVTIDTEPGSGTRIVAVVPAGRGAPVHMTFGRQPQVAVETSRESGKLPSRLLLPTADERVLAVLITGGEAQDAVRLEGIVPGALRRERIAVPGVEITIELRHPLLEILGGVGDPLLLRGR